MIANIIEADQGESFAASIKVKTENTLRILIVDDHAIVRHGLKFLLLNEFKSAVIAEAENGDKAVELVRKHAWDIVVLDLSLPGCSGLDILKRMIALRPGMAVLVLSMYSEDQYAIRVLKEGAAGYLSKECGGEEIIHVIKKALAGQKHISSSLAEKLALNLGNCRQGKPHETLSSREDQVLRLIGAGKSIKEIGFELGLSNRTVSTYRTRLLGKMNLGTNADLIRYALFNQLVD
ncbi:MAG: Response regulator, LuxR family [Pedosphaera sp.]|nr:Response regulator, LuxR family [Pedosphaera sp.]